MIRHLSKILESNSFVMLLCFGLLAYFLVEGLYLTPMKQRRWDEIFSDPNLFDTVTAEVLYNVGTIKSPTVEIKYTVKGNEIYETFSVKRSEAKEYWKGQRFRVLYAKEDPTIWKRIWE